MSTYIHWPPQKITRSEWLFMFQWSHYQAVFIHHSLSSSDQNQISCSGRFWILPQKCTRRCCCVYLFAIEVILTNRNSMTTLSTVLPLLEMLYLLQLVRGKYSHMVFSSLTRLSSHVAYADMASSVGGLTDKMKQNSFCYFRLCTTVELIITFFQWGHNERLSRL